MAVKKLLMTLVAVGVGSLAAWGQDAPTCAKCKKESYGTSVVWAGTPSEAAAKAKEEQKLVFVLHVSGNFEDPTFT
jgi:hypothetical protein